MKKLLLFFALLLQMLSPIRVFADSNFKTDYAVTYNVLENALTHVVFDVSLTNKTSQYYASSYSIQVGFKEIENVLVRDSLGKITPEIIKNDDGNKIGLTFNDRVVGLDKKLNFTISFDTKEIARKSGKIWDINIPGLTEQNEYNSFNVKVVVPKSLDRPSYVKPDTGKVIDNNLTFTKDELGKSGISISYGKEQIYNFNLLYHLKNSNMFPIKTEIALPPSTNYQDVQIEKIDPNPINVVKDLDGNWLAQYVLSPGKKIDITVNGKAKIMLSPKKQQLSDEELKVYLKEQPYWEASKDIKELAQKLKTPYEIYQYVVNALTYDFGRVEKGKARIGALELIKDPSSAVCLEFTDLFIAIARAAGIPSREIDGFAFTQNSRERPLSLVKDVLHAWPEYYDYELQTWVMIDPTWGNTTGGVDYFYTLDYDHFAFVIKGASSTYPVPAGGYKISENNLTKDIEVNLGEVFASQTQTLNISTDFPDSLFSGFALQGNIAIKNNGKIISTPQEMTIGTDFLTPSTQKIAFGSIPPYGFLKIPVKFNKPSLLTNKTDTIRIAINESYITKSIKISPFVFNKWTILGGAIFASIIIGISIAIYKTRNLPFLRFKRKDPLRGESQKS